MKERKPLVALLVAERGKKGDDKEEESAAADDAPDPGEEAAMTELATALGTKPKDLPGAVSALRDFVRMCIAKDRRGSYTEKKKD